jgi:ribosomal protein S12 methylthiotransferase
MVSQDTTSWGADLGDGVDLASLLRQIDTIPGEFWVRLMYAHPACLTDRHVAAIADCEKIVPYIDMPLQHISDRMLTIMNRHTTRAKTEERIRALRQARPDMALRTTFIVGHPGETDADFEELLDFAAETEFERMGVFSYSKEENTPAARMDEVVPESLSRERADRLSIAYDRWSSDQSLDKVGQTIPSLLEVSPEAGVWMGRTIHDAPEIDGSITVADHRITASGFYPLLVTEANGVDLAGQLLKGNSINHDAHPMKVGTIS